MQACWCHCTQVSVLRLEVQRLNVARQQAEAARAAAEERAAGSQAVAEALQRELAKVLAASDGPHAQQARAAVDADNMRLRQQLEVQQLVRSPSLQIWRAVAYLNASSRAC